MTEYEGWKQKELKDMACAIDELHTLDGNGQQGLGYLVRANNKDWATMEVNVSKVNEHVPLSQCFLDQDARHNAELHAV